MKCISGKVQYPTYWAADRENRRKVREHCVQMDIYKCKWCNQYHLTGHNKQGKKQSRR